MARFFTSSLLSGAMTASLIAIACSGNSSLGGGGGANSVGGSTSSANGGSNSTGGSVTPGNGGTIGNGGKTGTGGDCGLIECFRAVECVQSCGGPIVSSGCCPCAAGTFDRISCGGSGGSSSTGGTTSTGAYQPCAGKTCGNACTVCPPNSTDCVETAVVKFCSLSGQCEAGTAQCGTTPSTGGATAAGGRTATGGSKGTGGSAGAGGSGGTDTGGKPATGGSQSSGGATGSVTCGTAVCAAGDYCCNSSCSICSPPNGGCIQMVCSSGGSTSLGGTSGTGGATGLPGLHSSCLNGTCASGLTAVTYYGVAGTSGPQFCSCEIPCTGTARTCPTGLVCSSISDGPSNICVNGTT